MAKRIVKISYDPTIHIAGTMTDNWLARRCSSEGIQAQKGHAWPKGVEYSLVGPSGRVQSLVDRLRRETFVSDVSVTSR